MGPAGRHGDKKARQNAALQVLQQAGYSVSFDPPPGPAHGAGFAPPPGPPQHPRAQQYTNRSLDVRHAQAAAQREAGVSRDGYLASLSDELG